MCTQSDEYMYAHGTMCFWDFVMLFCMPTMVLPDQNLLKWSVVNVDRFLLFYNPFSEKTAPWPFLLPDSPLRSSDAQMIWSCSDWYGKPRTLCTQKTMVIKIQNKENHVSYLPAAKLSKHNSALAPQALTNLAHQSILAEFDKMEKAGKPWEVLYIIYV